LLLIARNFYATSQGLQIPTNLPPIEVTIRANGYWYNFHEGRTQIMEYKLRMYDKLKNTLTEAEELNKQVIEAKKQSDATQIQINNELSIMKNKFNNQTFLIKTLETELLKCKNDLGNQVDYSKLLNDSYKRAKREKWWIIGGLTAVVGTSLYMGLK